MPFDLQFHDDLARLTFHGKVVADDLHQLLPFIAELETRLDVSPDRLSVFADADISGLRGSDVAAFARMRKAAQLKNPVRSAIVAPTTEQYGVCRMFIVYNQNPRITLALFREPAGALEWLGHAHLAPRLAGGAQANCAGASPLPKAERRA